MWVPKFSLNWKFWFFFLEQIFPKRKKITLVRAPVVVIYFIKLFRTWADRHNGILMSLLLPVAETIKNVGFIENSNSNEEHFEVKKFHLKSKGNLFFAKNVVNPLWATLHICNIIFSTSCFSMVIRSLSKMYLTLYG